MTLTDYISEDHIVTGFKADSKDQALTGLCRLAGDLARVDPEKFFEVVQAREKIGSTGLGGGVALPHGKSGEVDRPLLVMAVSPSGVDFDSLDGQPAHVFVLMLTPLNGDGHGREHLQILASLGALFKSPQAVREIRSAGDAGEIFDFLTKRDRAVL